jgi:hypothetical protein
MLATFLTYLLSLRLPELMCIYRRFEGSHCLRVFIQVDSEHGLILFGAESFIFQFAVQNVKDQYIYIYRTVILPVLYGCETWSLTLREQSRLRVFENRVPRRIFGPKRDEVTGGWRKLHNEELSDLYSLPNIVRVVKSIRMR